MLFCQQYNFVTAVLPSTLYHKTTIATKLLSALHTQGHLYVTFTLPPLLVTVPSLQYTHS